MDDLIVFPDAEDIAAQILAPVGPAHRNIPADRPEEFFRIIRTGGPRLNLVTDEAVLIIESFALTDDAAQDNAQLARAHLRAARATVVDGVSVYRVDEVAGPARLPDPLSNQPRYTQTVTLALRGATPSGS